MRVRSDDGPAHFARRWLAFDETRPTRPRLARRFIAALVICLLASAMLAIIAGKL